MDANEVIKRLKSKSNYITRGNQPTRDWTTEVTVVERDEIIRELNRSRIRITKDELPTREDADRFQHVLAFDRKLQLWDTYSFHHIKANSTIYPYWTCLPELPEVTP